MLLGTPVDADKKLKVILQDGILLELKLDPP
jgi:hypothetical protein